MLRNLDHDAAHPAAAGPGHWNDPDYLGPGLGMTPDEARAQLSMWAIVAAPLILGSDPRTLSTASVKMLTNPRVIARRPGSARDSRAGRSASTARARCGSGRLTGGARAVALLNRGATALQIATSARRLGLPRARSYELQDLWTGTVTTTAGAISARIAPRSAALYRVTPIR